MEQTVSPKIIYQDLLTIIKTMCEPLEMQRLKSLYNQVVERDLDDEITKHGFHHLDDFLAESKDIIFTFTYERKGIVKVGYTQNKPVKAKAKSEKPVHAANKSSDTDSTKALCGSFLELNLSHTSSNKSGTEQKESVRDNKDMSVQKPSLAKRISKCLLGVECEKETKVSQASNNHVTSNEIQSKVPDSNCRNDIRPPVLEPPEKPVSRPNSVDEVCSNSIFSSKRTSHNPRRQQNNFTSVARANAMTAVPPAHHNSQPYNFQPQNRPMPMQYRSPLSMLRSREELNEYCYRLSHELSYAVWLQQLWYYLDSYNHGYRHRRP